MSSPRPDAFVRRPGDRTDSRGDTSSRGDVSSPSDAPTAASGGNVHSDGDVPAGDGDRTPDPVDHEDEHDPDGAVRDALGALASGTAPRVAIDDDALRRGRRASADVTAFAAFVADGGEERLERSLRAARRRDATEAASRAASLLDAIAAFRRAAAVDD